MHPKMFTMLYNQMAEMVKVAPLDIGAYQTCDIIKGLRIYLDKTLTEIIRRVRLPDSLEDQAHSMAERICWGISEARRLSEEAIRCIDDTVRSYLMLYPSHDVGGSRTTTRILEANKLMEETVRETCSYVLNTTREFIQLLEAASDSLGGLGERIY